MGDKLLDWSKDQDSCFLKLTFGTLKTWIKKGAMSKLSFEFAIVIVRFYGQLISQKKSLS